MTSKSDNFKTLTLIRLDANSLLERVVKREAEYMQVFSAKRTREHFPKIFKNRYETMTFRDLSICEPDTMVALDSFYTKVDEMQWYLYCTEEMPGTVQDKVGKFILELEKLHETLELYINAEIEALMGRKPALVQDGEF